MLLVLVPASFVTLADAVGWGSCIVSRPLRPMFPRLLAVRISCDAVCSSLPAGVAFGESLRAALLKVQFGIGLLEGATCCLLGKLNLAVAHMAYLVVVTLGLLLGTGGRIPLQGLPGGAASLVAGAAGAALIGGLLALSYTGPRLSQAIRGLGRVRIGIIRRTAAVLAPRFSLIDEQVGALARAHPAHLARSIGAYFSGWLALASESALILALLGADVPLAAALGIEAVVSLMRIAFFFLPSAVGAAEVAYVGMLTALGVSDPVTTSAAFITIKRSREALWVLVGYAVLLGVVRPPRIVDK